jgi:hypothetical protein
MRSYDPAVYHSHISAFVFPCFAKSLCIRCRLNRNSGDCMASRDVKEASVNRV